MKTLRRSPAFRPRSAFSKPGNRLSSPQTKDAGAPPKLESTSVPSISRTAKCRVMRISGPARNGAVSLIGFLSCKQHINDQQYRAESDGTVGKIECREV